MVRAKVEALAQERGQQVGKFFNRAWDDIVVNGQDVRERLDFYAEELDRARKLLYADDFSNPNSDWRRRSTDVSEKDYEDGEYHIPVKKSGYHSWMDNESTGQFADFAVEIDAGLASGPNESRYDMVFRLQDSDNFYRFLVSGNGYYLVGGQLNDEWTVMQSWTESAAIKQGNNTNHLKVVCKGSQIDVYVNGHHLTTVTG